ncbi:MAG: hypothetical protein GY745_02665 [Actinomycetia bacterium]|nr:hypothetical protein [Actinomycetes bacterium]
MVLYAIARAAVVWPTLSTYGVSPAVFLIIDVATAWPYAVGQVKVVQGLRRKDWRHAQLWSLVALISFLAPYLYIVGAGSGELPVIAYVIIGALITVLGAASVMRVLRQVRP